MIPILPRPPSDVRAPPPPDASDLEGRGPQPHLSTSESALFATLAYVYGSGKGDEETKIQEVEERLEGTGFKLQPSFSNRQLSVFYKATPQKTHLHIAHKGTQPNSVMGMLDVISDYRLAINAQGRDYQFRYRLTATERAYRHFRPRIFTMSGHSLGGATVIHTLHNSSFLWRAIDQVDTFNAGANPFPKISFGRFFKPKTHRKKIKKLDNVVTHHRMTGDLVSVSMKHEKPTGEVRTYDFQPTGNAVKTALDSHHLDLFENTTTSYATTGYTGQKDENKELDKTTSLL